MKKLLNGLIEFRRNILPANRQKFAELARRQNPDALFISCSDSRVAPNWFASTDPGDLFVVRNVGNLIPCCGKDGHSTADESEAAAIEFAVLHLNVKDIIVCGHSDCGAMHALLQGRHRPTLPSNLRAWLRHGDISLEKFSSIQETITQNEDPLLRVNLLSQMNVLQQLNHLRSYPAVQQRLEENKLKLHAWWFDISTATVYAYDPEKSDFAPIDEEQAERILSESTSKSEMKSRPVDCGI
jgi:carbonic anhydrase